MISTNFNVSYLEPKKTLGYLEYQQKRLQNLKKQAKIEFLLKNELLQDLQSSKSNLDNEINQIKLELKQKETSLQDYIEKTELEKEKERSILTHKLENITMEYEKFQLNSQNKFNELTDKLQKYSHDNQTLQLFNQESVKKLEELEKKVKDLKMENLDLKNLNEELSQVQHQTPPKNEENMKLDQELRNQLNSKEIIINQLIKENSILKSDNDKLLKNFTDTTQSKSIIHHSEALNLLKKDNDGLLRTLEKQDNKIEELKSLIRKERRKCRFNHVDQMMKLFELQNELFIDSLKEEGEIDDQFEKEKQLRTCLFNLIKDEQNQIIAKNRDSSHSQ